MAEIDIRLKVNGADCTVRTEPCKTLLALIREDLGLFSVKDGCGQGDCGSCVVVMNGQAVNACLVLAAQAAGSEILTLEGLSREDALHPLQRQFAAHWAFQCGYCTPGMLMASYALISRNPNPTRTDVHRAIEGNLCRCTSYRAIIEAVLQAAEENRKKVAGLESAHD